MDIENISDWIRWPFLLLNSVLKFIMRNLISLIIAAITIVIIWYLIKFFRFWKRFEKETAEEEERLKDSKLR